MGVYFLGAIIIFLLIAWWVRRNDKVPLDGETTGLFRMRISGNAQEGESPVDKARGKPKRIGSTAAPLDVPSGRASPGNGV